jgi:hypothetical protein
VSTDEHENITPEDFDLMAWIASGTVATRTVDIFNRPDMVAEYEALEAEYAEAEKAAARAGDDAPLSAVDPRPDIEARMAEWRERWEASKATWTVRALSHDEIENTFEPKTGGVSSPPQPVPPPAQAGKKAAEDYAEKVTKWARTVHEADRERTLHLIAAAVTAVESTRGRLERDPGEPPIVTVEALRTLRDRPHGDTWVGMIPSGKGQRVTGKLATAVMAATEGDVAVPRPTSPGRSTTTQG